jgi:coenzyme Q-binding protein COQ10
MASHSESRLVPYGADFMYAIVADVELYPKFVPWCVDLKVESREKTDAGETLIADTTVGFRNFRETYTSKVTLDPAARKIDIVQTKGVFKEMETHWEFMPEGDHCLIEFAIAFEFKSTLLGLIADAAFGRVQSRMAEAFEKRAERLSKKPVQKP